MLRNTTLAVRGFRKSGMRMVEGRGVGQCIIWDEDGCGERSGTVHRLR